MDLSRDDFIAFMIAELSRQQTQDAEAFLRPRQYSTGELFRKLCFDFPDVTNEDLERLSTGLKEIFESERFTAQILMESSDPDDLIQIFTLDYKFIENLIFISGEAGNSIGTIGNMGQKRSEIAGLLCCNIFLTLPRHTIACTRQRISAIFNGRPIALGSTGDSSSVILEWPDILRRYYSLVSRCSASLISGAGPDALVRGRYVTDLCCSISIFNPFQVLDKAILKTQTEKTILTARMKFSDFIGYIYLLNGTDKSDRIAQNEFAEVQFVTQY